MRGCKDEVIADDGRDPQIRLRVINPQACLPLRARLVDQRAVIGVADINLHVVLFLHDPRPQALQICVSGLHLLQNAGQQLGTWISVHAAARAS